jgi:hypothetical protein
VERPEAQFYGSLDVLNSIVDKERLTGFYTKPRQAQLEDHRIRLRHPNLA